ncbi:hypothetical protein IQ249_08680 [Lusitaniella coriacea LEGE 07157]|uniref:Anti-sigma factor n=1 Tax=Lusitaniella coriacea LEGE 07157 TaxID=945747 RepID=A0A8J7DVQ6_9CYAN|nr:hypothetical protein [Lusitaniella coriacea]MBE9115966.1 hypothetical protein [Lusitaniella coriacea LEGE 07157]
MSKRFQDLAAGYVLGNLNSEEAEEFQKSLTAHPEFAKEIDRLQEVLGLMSYDVSERAPSPSLREKILFSARVPPKTSRISHFVRQTQKSCLSRSGPAIGVAALLAIALGINNFRLHRRLQFLQAQQLQISQDAIAFTASETFLLQNWEGIEELLEDRQNSLNRNTGPVDFASSQPAEIVKQFQPKTQLPSPLPLLNDRGLKLLGGSFCKLGKTRGIRLTYQQDPARIISFYQLELTPNASFPKLTQERLYLHRSQEPDLVLWRDRDFLYVLVANGSPTELQHLATTVITQ